ncbi:hypothetical protein GCM10011531_04080 [Aquaticitalea lipolytica]|uniref:Uncharacterized protein n=1 Tax=Aquaticitalea lipolytica TaxID=1247562 RepID=A0A8J2TKF4_9FLAO|nr:hypothetical protein GCM10011531_04080 [Aquaticitalea lipolytica]
MQIDEGNLAFNEMLELIGKTKIDTNKIKSVKIYSYEFKKNGNIKDSTLIEHQNLNYFSTFKDHTNYEIKYDSLGRDFERYATRIETGETHLNYKKIYDSKSKITEWIVYNRDGQVNSKTFYYYDNLERLIKTEKYYGYFLYEKPILQRKKVLEYKSETLIKETEYSSVVSSDQFDSKLIKEYNKKGQQIDYRSETLENDITVSFWGFKSFYKGEKLIKKESYGSDNRDILTEFKYNSLNLPIENYSTDLNLKKPTRLTKYYYLENKKTTHNNVYN